MTGVETGLVDAKKVEKKLGMEVECSWINL
jgi:hypothetical protein